MLKFQTVSSTNESMVNWHVFKNIRVQTFCVAVYTVAISTVLQHVGEDLWVSAIEIQNQKHDVFVLLH